jgi:hypothetical protein
VYCILFCSSVRGEMVLYRLWVRFESPTARWDQGDSTIERMSSSYMYPSQATPVTEHGTKMSHQRTSLTTTLCPLFPSWLPQNQLGKCQGGAKWGPRHVFLAPTPSFISGGLVPLPPPSSPLRASKREVDWKYTAERRGFFDTMGGVVGMKSYRDRRSCVYSLWD